MVFLYALIPGHGKFLPCILRIGLVFSRDSVKWTLLIKVELQEDKRRKVS